jgi:hypothetical protein
MKERSGAWLPAGFALLLLLGFHALVAERTGLDPTSLGYHAVEVSPGYGRFLGYYLFFGLFAAAALALALRRGERARRLLVRLKARLEEGEDRGFVLAVALMALALGLLCRRFLLMGMPLTDDEVAYRFAAQILGEGRLYLPSDPDRAFFDHVFLVNDGRTYTQYFLGWPALMLPALLLGLEGYANAFFFALAIPAVFLVLRRLAGSFWARLGALLTLGSPMLFISAGTLLSHSSCFAALSWALLCALRCDDRDASWRWHAGFALCLGAAFFIRPLTALAIGLPLLACWFRHCWWSGEGRGRRLLAFALPAALAAGLFFAVNAGLNGDPLKTAYQSYQQYKFQDREPRPAERELALLSPSNALSQAAAAFHRLGFAAFGWPISWLFVFFAGKGKGHGRILATIPLFFLCYLPVLHVGIDTYAPMHYVELGLPMVVLTVLGIKRSSAWLEGQARPLGSLPLELAAASALVAALGLLPYQLDGVHKAALLEKITRDAVAELPGPAVLFVKQPYYTRACFPSGLKNWVHHWPLNPPVLDEEQPIWLAHLELARDRELMARRFPGRRGFLLTWRQDSCERLFVPLELANERDFPPVAGGRVKL